MEGSGWVKIYRQLLENPVVNKTAGHISVWIFLLLNAAHRETDVIFNGKRTTIQAGQLVTTRSKICRMFRDEPLTVQNVRTILNDFEKDGQISRTQSSGGTLFTITNWTLYQDGKTEQLTDHQPAKEVGCQPTKKVGYQVGEKMPTKPTTARNSDGYEVGYQEGENVGCQPTSQRVINSPANRPSTDHQPTEQEIKNVRNNNNIIYNNTPAPADARAREEPPPAPEGFEYVGRHKDTGEPSFRKKNPTPEDIDAFFEYFKQTGKPIRLTAEEDYIK